VWKLDDSVALAAYSEIALKSEPVRRRLERMLMDDTRFMVERVASRRPLVVRSRKRIVVRAWTAKSITYLCF